MGTPPDRNDEPPPPRRDAPVAALLMAAVLLGALAYLVYGPDLDSNGVVGFPVLIAIPLSIGGLIAVAVDPRGKRSAIGCAAYPALILCAITFVMWLIAGEGAICIAMMLALWIPVALGGALTNRWLRARQRRHDDDNWRFRTSAWAALPALAFIVDAAIPLHWTSHSVVREVMLPTSPERAWPLLVSIPDIAPDEGRWTFTHDVLGVPRPTHAVLRHDSESPALVRKAQWGPDIRFDERITAIRPARSIAWRFSFPDDSVQRHTDRHISPDGPTLRIASGRYDLLPARPGCVRLRLTTTYQSRSRLDAYFAWWGDRLLGDVQANVLSIIAGRVARNNVAPPSACARV